MPSSEKKCAGCGQRFEGAPNAKFCGKSCRQAYHDRRRAIPRNTSFFDPKVPVVCGNCGIVITGVQRRRRVMYCSQACRQAGWRKLNQAEVVCDVCGKVVSRPRSAINAATKNHFCSTTCKAKWMSENWRGPAHPNWKELESLITIVRRTIMSDRRYKIWHDTVMANANNTCQRCGEPATDAHHIREVAELLALIVDPANGEALCTDCHVNHHG